MPFVLAPELLDLKARVRQFVDERLMPHEVYAEHNGGELPSGEEEKVEAALDVLGVRAMSIPVSLGGPGLSFLAQALISIEIGRVTNGLGWCVTTPARGVAEAASPHQRAIWIEPTIRGERHECIAITEADAGSDVDALRTSARRVGEDYFLDGEKWHVTSFNKADYMLVQAKLADGPHAGAHALFFVDVDMPGVSVVRTPLYTHTYSHHHPIVALAGVRVPAANRIGPEGEGLGFTQDWFRYERLMIAARCCGAAERLIDEATAFAQHRIVFGEPLIDKQAVRMMLADSATELWAGRLMVLQLAAAYDALEDAKVLHARCAMAKLYCSEMANRVADRAVQIFGGRGYMRENVAERFFRELRVDRIWEGASEIQREIIAAGIAKRGAARLIG